MSATTLEINGPEVGAFMLLTVLKCPACSEGVIAGNELQRILRKAREPAGSSQPGPALRPPESGAGH